MTTLHYSRPAVGWTQALPLGSGRLGAMVSGGVSHDLMQLNEETLWSGYRQDWDNPGAAAVLPEIRALIAQHRFAEADRLCARIMGPYTQSFLPLADLEFRFAQRGTAERYRRSLDLDQAIASVSYRIGDVDFTRTYLCSHADQVLAIHLAASKPGALSFDTTLSSPLQSAHGAQADGLLLHGHAPEVDLPHYLDAEDPIRYTDPAGTRAMSFAVALRAVCDEGTITVDPDGAVLRVRGARTATIILDATTSFGLARIPASDRLAHMCAALTRHLDRASAVGFDGLCRRHTAEHQGLFGRVSLALGSPDPARESLDTDSRLQQYDGHDTGLIELLFQYGRYLLISSSRAGGKPANLQGVWNKDVRPAWSSNYTLNINAEMNYWPAEVCNLSECHVPLLDLIRELSENGRQTARTNYGARGWVAHHNTDIWAQSAPAGGFGHGDPVWTIWPLGGAWLCQHLWEHFLFTQDVRYLREFAYPCMKDAAQFCLDWLYRDDSGLLVTAPSTSPEHKFWHGGTLCAVSAASTMDMALMWELFSDCIAAARVLETDRAFAEELHELLGSLCPPRIARDGRLQEWSCDFAEAEPHHRHLSHLVGVYPGRQISAASPVLFEAARASLESRGDDSVGWGLAWRACLWARLGDGNRALRLVSAMLRPVGSDAENHGEGGTYPNLFSAHPPYQIDGNLGATAAVAEMLLQSQQGHVHLLPALPDAWPTGEFRGLRARGGFEIDLSWSAHRSVHCVVRSLSGMPFRLLAPSGTRVSADGHPVQTTRLDSLLCFETRPGAAYDIRFPERPRTGPLDAETW